MTIDGKRVLVTGGASGIGLAAAQRLRALGAKVIVTGRSEASVVEARSKLGAEAIAIVSDATSPVAISELADRVRASLGGLDALLHCAGQTRFVPTFEVTEQVYDDLQAVNAKGAYFTIQKLAPLIERGGGVVVITSVADARGMPMVSAYAASKAALRSMVRSFARDLRPQGVRVNAVSPGAIESGILEKTLPAQAADKVRQGIIASNPMGRFGHPDEVVAAMLFLAFEATYTTGAELVVDGGATQL